MKFYLFRSGELSSKRKKAEPFARKNGRKAPQRKKYLISGFGHLRCSALENPGSKSPQTRMKPEKNGTTSILSSLHGAGEGKAAAPQRADSPRGGAPLPASSLKTYHRYVFLTLRPSQGSIPRHSEKKESSHKGCFPFLNGGDRIDTAQPQEEKAKINDLFYGGYFRVSDL